MKRLFYLLYGFILVTCITHSLTMNNPSHNTNPNQWSVRNHGNNDDADIGFDFSDLEDLPEYLWNECTDQSEGSYQELPPFIQNEVPAYEEQQTPQPRQSCPCLLKTCAVTAKSQPEIEAHTLDHFKIKCHGCNIISNASHIYKHFQLKRHAQHPKPRTYQAWQKHVKLLVDKGLHFLLASVDTDKLTDSARPFISSLKDNLSAEDHVLLSTVIPTFDGKSIVYGNTESLHNSPVVYEEAEECTYQQSPDCIVQSHDSDNNTNEEDESTTKTLFVNKHIAKEIFLCPWKGCSVKKVFNNCSYHLATHIKMKCFACDKLLPFNKYLKRHLLKAHSDSHFNQKTAELRNVLTKKRSKLTSLFLVANLLFDHLKPYVQDALIKNDSFINKSTLLNIFTLFFKITLSKKGPYVLLDLKDPADLPTLGSQNPEAGSSLPHAAEAEDESTTKTLLVDQHTKKELFLCPWKGCAIKQVLNNCSKHLLTHVKIICFICERLLCFRDLKIHLLQEHSDSHFNQKTLKLRTVLANKDSNLTSLFLLANLMFDYLKPYVQAKFKESASFSEYEAPLKTLKDNFDSVLANNNKYIILTPKDTALPSNKRQRTDQASAAQPSPALLPAAQNLIPDQLEDALPVQEQSEPYSLLTPEVSCDETAVDWIQFLNSDTTEELNQNFFIGK